jgi:hypothetical protein
VIAVAVVVIFVVVPPPVSVAIVFSVFGFLLHYFLCYIHLIHCQQSILSSWCYQSVLLLLETVIESKLIIITDIHECDLAEKWTYVVRAHDIHKLVHEWWLIIIVISGGSSNFLVRLQVVCCNTSPQHSFHSAPGLFQNITRKSIAVYFFFELLWVVNILVC